MVTIYLKGISIRGKDWFCRGEMQERFEVDERSSRWKDSMMAQHSFSKKLISHLERCRKLLAWCAGGGGPSRWSKFDHLQVDRLIQLKTHSLEVLENMRDKDVGKMRWLGESRGDKTSWGFKSGYLIQVCRKVPHCSKYWPPSTDLMVSLFENGNVSFKPHFIVGLYIIRSSLLDDIEYIWFQVLFYWRTEIFEFQIWFMASQKWVNLK